MELTLTSRFKRAWNAFTNNRDPTFRSYVDAGPGYSYYPDRPRLTRGNERSIVTAIFNRIALDVASLDIQHVQLDEDGRYSETLKTGLNNCLTLESNIDQTAFAFKQDLVLTMLDKGVAAIIPVDTSADPRITDSFDIYSWRVGEILEWFPAHVRVRVYNDRTGRKEDLILPKRSVAIIPNPLYTVVNEPSSTMQRLVRKLNLLDAIDEQSGSGKLDLIVQLPYVIKSKARQQQAEDRRKAIEEQLAGSKYGIAYTDGTERITQLNRPVENNLLKQVEYLTNMLHSQLGMTQGVLDGTADEKTQLSYECRIINPIVTAIVDGIKRTFLTKTARSQGKSIMYFRDPFERTPASDFAEMADKFARNEIMTKNEIRQKLGMKPSNDPKADQLSNPNINQSGDAPPQPAQEGEIQNGSQSPEL